jgi:PAS domain S-box-containing protein
MDDKKSEKRLEELELEMSNQESKEVLESYRKEKSFRKALENAIPSGIAVIDDTGRQVYVNPAFCKMTGWSKDDLVGQSPPYVYWSPDDMENINEALQKTLNNDAPQEGFDLVFSHKTGKPIYVNVIISPFIQEDKRTFWLANVIDITKRKQEEEALIKSKILLRSSIESMKEIIFFSIDKNYKYSLYNEAHRIAMKFAYNSDIMIDKSILDYISVDVDRKLLKNNFDLALRGQSHSQIQTLGDQNIAHYEVFYDPIMNDNNEIIGCTVLAKNIT